MRGELPLCCERSGEFRGTRPGFRGGSSWLGIVPSEFRGKRATKVRARQFDGPPYLRPYFSCASRYSPVIARVSDATTAQDRRLAGGVWWYSRRLIYSLSAHAVVRADYGTSSVQQSSMLPNSRSMFGKSRISSAGTHIIRHSRWYAKRKCFAIGTWNCRTDVRI